MQVKTTMRDKYMPVRMTKMKCDDDECCQGYRWNERLLSYYRRQNV